MNIKLTLHERILANLDQVRKWFDGRGEGLRYPIYSSYDIRDAGFKVAPVDANLFPAGFNNICDSDKEYAAEQIAEYLTRVEPHVKSIGLLTENHTGNKFYWDNVHTIQSLLHEAGYRVRISLALPDGKPQSIETASGKVVIVDSFSEVNAWADLWVSNNDFSSPIDEIRAQMKVKMVPSYEFGWHKRRKHQFFQHYNQLAFEFAELLGVDPAHLQVLTQRLEEFDIDDETSRASLKIIADSVLKDAKSGYSRMGVEGEPHLFLKNNKGTYGLGVLAVENPDEILTLSYKQRKKMKASKGGGGVEDVILQESIPTSLIKNGVASEPVVYLVGPHRIGGFLRTHDQKGPDDSLNSPGMVFRRLCFADIQTHLEHLPEENVYGWVAKLGALACAIELKELTGN